MRDSMGQLSEEERLARKKKILAAGENSDFASAMSTLFGARMNTAGNPVGY